MKKDLTGLAVFAASALLAFQCAAGDAARPRQYYDIAPDKAASNAQKVADDLKTAAPSWKNAPAVYYSIPPLSDIRRGPDTHPSDGTIAAPLEYIAAKGEYEAGSFVVYPMKKVDSFVLKASDLKSASGAVIPASGLDIKILKIWYQAGSAWHGYFADALGRMLVPELLLNDETIIYADPKTQDNYILYRNKDGSERYFWASANFMVTNYAFSNQVNLDLVSDAETLQSAVLNKGEYKQFFATLHVPENTPEGIYKGSISMTADGKTFGSVPVTVRVLPFTLPDAKTNYNQEKGFYLSLYGTETDNPKILKNLARHNGHPMGMPSLTTFTPEKFEAQVHLMEQCGLKTRPIFAGAASAGITVSNNELSADDMRKLKNFERQIKETGELCKKVLGHTDFYSYGVDEGGADTIRAERQAWKRAHDAGGKVMVTSFPHKRLLFALDYLIIPGAPVEKRVKEVAKFHESNPDALCGWYANPHSGPENPNYFRRVHGYEAWKGDYDVSSNYCWWRNNWNDIAVPYEPNLRSLVSIYAARDNVIDTLEWEGIREGLDDVRYGTLLKQLALKAAKSKNGDTLMLGRNALSFLAYSDEKRDDLDATRLEMINFILRLTKALEGEK